MTFIIFFSPCLPLIYLQQCETQPQPFYVCSCSGSNFHMRENSQRGHLTQTLSLTPSYLGQFHTAIFPCHNPPKYFEVVYVLAFTLAQHRMLRAGKEIHQQTRSSPAQQTGEWKRHHQVYVISPNY